MWVVKIVDVEEEDEDGDMDIDIDINIDNDIDDHLQGCGKWKEWRWRRKSSQGGLCPAKPYIAVPKTIYIKEIDRYENVYCKVQWQ